MKKKVSIIMAVICSIIVGSVNPSLVYANTTKTNVEEVTRDCLRDKKSQKVSEALETINKAERCKIISKDIKSMFDEEVINEFGTYTEEEVITEIRNYIEDSDIITYSEDIDIRVLGDKEVADSDYYIVVESLDEMVEYLEATQIVVENGTYIDTEEVEKNLARAASKTTSTTQVLSKAVSLVTFADLRATITYNTSTGVITKVSNMSLELSGVTLTNSMENVSTHYYLSPTKKYVKVTGDYTDVARFITPVGEIEIARNHAYVQFKYNYTKGMYEKKGGYGYSDTSF